MTIIFKIQPHHSSPTGHSHSRHCSFSHHRCISISECLKIVYEEMLNHRHLIITNPNLVIQLLHTNVNFNYFAGIHFQQIQGTAMGTAFSPTVAIIFMSIFINNFLKAQSEKPLLLVRYIDDIFLIWPTKDTLNQFLVQLDNFHPNIKFTHSVSDIYQSISLISPSTKDQTSKPLTG